MAVLSGGRLSTVTHTWGGMQVPPGVSVRASGRVCECSDVKTVQSCPFDRIGCACCGVGCALARPSDRRKLRCDRTTGCGTPRVVTQRCRSLGHRPHATGGSPPAGAIESGPVRRHARTSPAATHPTVDSPHTQCVQGPAVATSEVPDWC